MRVLGLLVLAGLIIACQKSGIAQEANNAAIVDRIRIDEEIHSCGAVDWTAEVKFSGELGDGAVEIIRREVAAMLAVQEDGLLAEVRDGGRLTFIPKSVIVDVPFVDNGAISIRTESRPIHRPAIEQVKVDRTTTAISIIVRFSHEATAVQQLQTLLAVGKYIEAQGGCGRSVPSGDACEDGTNSHVTVNQMFAGKLVTIPDGTTCGCSCQSGMVQIKLKQLDARTYLFE